MNYTEGNGPIPLNNVFSTFCILVDSAELTRALETVFNKMNGTDIIASGQLTTIAEIAKKGPEICLILNTLGDHLCVWGIDVSLSNILLKQYV